MLWILSNQKGDGVLILYPEISIKLSAIDPPFDQVMALRGEVYRALENRCTQRIVLGQQAYFVKQHFGVGWKEIIKNYCQLKRPVVSAKNEWQALQRLALLDIAVQEVVGYGERGWNPARRESFLITRELPKHISLEDLCKKPLSVRMKRSLIAEVARIARTLHTHGINHRDFYLCHFLLDLESDKKPLKLYLIDLHRAEIRQAVPLRWIIKDLAGLYFSSKEAGLTRRDYLRFIRAYRNQPLREIVIRENAFWQKVRKRGDKLYDECN